MIEFSQDRVNKKTCDLDPKETAELRDDRD
jgi:hypothetical protein